MNKYSSRKDTCRGIDLSKLRQTHAKLITNRVYVQRLSEDDRILNILFYCLDTELDHVGYNKIYYAKHIDKFVAERSVPYINSVIKWKCAECGKTIYINTNEKIDYSHVLCFKCIKKNKGELTDKIVKEYIDLTTFITKKINKDYKKTVSKIKKNRKL
jgi:hypothetical protein